MTVSIGEIEAKLKLNDELTVKLNTAVRNIETRLGQVEQHAAKASRGVGRITSSITELSSVGGRGAEELAGKIEALTSKFGGLAATVTELGPLAPALAAIAAGVIGVVVAFKGLSILADIVRDGMEVQAVVTQLEASLRANGSAARLTSNDMAEYASSLVTVTGLEDEAILAGELILTRFRRIGPEAFKPATIAALDLARATGKDLKDAFTIVGKSLEEPGRGLAALKEVGITFTAGQRKTLQAMIDTNNIAGYQSIILRALQEHVGGAAAAYQNTLAGAISTARAEASEFSENIASEVIPALEFLVQELVAAAGGWEVIHHVISEASHGIGNAIRQMVYGIVIQYHQWELAQDTLIINLVEGLRTFTRAALQVPIVLTEIQTRLPKVLGGGDRAESGLQSLRAIQSGIDQALESSLSATRKSAAGHVAAISRATSSLLEHRQALEGTNKLYKGLGDVLDEVAGKEGELASKVSTLTEKYTQAALAAHDKARAEAVGGAVLRQVNEQTQINAKILADVNSLEGLSATGKEKLKAILLQLANVEVYWNQQADIGKALLSERIQLDVELAQGAIKLQEARTGSSAATRLEAAAEEASRRAFALGLETNLDFVSSLARLIAARKNAAAATQLAIDKVKSDRQHTIALRSALADLADAKTNTTEASRELAVQLELENRILAKGGDIIGDEIADIEDEIRARHRRLATIKDETAAIKTLGDVLSEADFQDRIISIDISDSHLRDVEQRWLTLLHSMGVDVETASQEVLAKLAADLGTTIDGIKAALSTIADADTIRTIQSGGQSVLSAYQDERDNVVRIIEEKVGKIKNIERDGALYLARLANDFWSGQISNWSSVFRDLSDSFGGVFTALSRGMDIIAKAQNTYSIIFKAVTDAGGSANWGQTFGEIGAWLQIFKGVYDLMRQSQKNTILRGYDRAATVSMNLTSGVWNSGAMAGGGPIDSIRRNGEALTRQIQQTAEEFARALGGALSSFAALQINARRDGKYFKAFVDGVLVGQFETLEAAVKAALAAAVVSSNTVFKGVSDLVLNALNQVTATAGSIGEDSDALLSWLTKIREIAELNWSSEARSTNELILHLQDLWKALTQVKNITPEVVQGFQDLAGNMVQAFQDWSDSITGRQKTPAELLFDKQREGEIFNAKLKLYRASIELEKINIQAQVDALRRRGQIIGAGGGGAGGSVGGGGLTPSNNGLIGLLSAELGVLAGYVSTRATIAQAEISNLNGYVSARGQLAIAEGSIYQQQIDAYLAQLEALQRILDNLPDAIDIPSIRLPGTAGGGADTSVRDFRRRLDDIAHSGLPDVDAAFRNLQHQIRDLREEAARLRVPLSALGPAIAELTRQFQADLLRQARTLAGIGTDFTRRLQDGIDFFASLERLGRQTTGIPDWLRSILEGRFLDSMRADWQGRVDAFRGLTNPMLEIQAQANVLRQDLAALAAATGMSASQIAAAQAQIAEGIEFQRQSAVNTIVDKLFGYLKGSEKWAAKQHEFEIRKLELDFRLMEAQLRFLNAWDAEMERFFNAAHDAAIAAVNAPETAELSTAATQLSDAADAQRALTDRWKTVLDSLTEYQTSLRTDSTLGMVNSRTALGNSFSILQSLSTRALGGDITAAEGYRNAAESYRRNLIAFSPSSELAARRLQEIDDTISRLRGMYPQVSSSNPVVNSIGRLQTSVDTQTTQWTNHFASQTANDNAHHSQLNQTTSAGLDRIAARAGDTAAEVSGLRKDVQALSATILAWRTESRGAGDDILTKAEDIAVGTAKLAAAMDRGQMVGAVGG